MPRRAYGSSEDLDLLRAALMEQSANMAVPGRVPSGIAHNAYLSSIPRTFEQEREGDVLGEIDRRYFANREGDRARQSKLDDFRASATARQFETRRGVEEDPSTLSGSPSPEKVRTIRRFSENTKSVDPDAAMTAAQKAGIDPRVLAARVSGSAAIEAARQRGSAAAAAKPPTGADRNTLNYFRRMLEAERSARAAEDKVSTARDLVPSELPMVPEMFENFIATPEGQAYRQAQRMFTEARLRKESGAAIPENEFANDRRMNFRMPADTPETIKQKRRARLETMRGIGNASGRALQEFYGDQTLDDLLSEFNDPADAVAGAGTPPPAPQGWKYVPKPGGGWTAVEVP